MNIKELRERARLTQTEFGRRLGVSLATIQKLEADNNRKPTETIKKLIHYEFADYFDEFGDVVETSSGRKLQGQAQGLGYEVAKTKYTKLLEDSKLLKQQLEDKAKIIALLEHKINGLEDELLQYTSKNTSSF